MSLTCRIFGNLATINPVNHDLVEPGAEHLPKL